MVTLKVALNIFYELVFSKSSQQCSVQSMQFTVSRVLQGLLALISSYMFRSQMAPLTTTQWLPPLVQSFATEHVRLYQTVHWHYGTLLVAHVSIQCVIKEQFSKLNYFSPHCSTRYHTHSLIQYSIFSSSYSGMRPFL